MPSSRSTWLPACALAIVGLAVAPARADTTLNIAGSTTLLPMLSEAAQAYEAAHDNISIIVTGGGSRPAIARVVSKDIDMAASDVPVSGGPGDLVDNRIAIISFAFAVDPRAGIKNLTRAKMGDVLAGRVQNWKDVGGNDLPIVVINRPVGSGVRELVAQRIMDGAKFSGRALEDESTSSLVNDLKNTPGSIGYASFLSLRDSGLTLVGLDGAAPTDENVQNGSYPLWAFEHIITSGPPTREESRFLAFLETNRTLLHRHGYIAIRDLNVASP